jgi:dTDP-4-dehydrorhamnose reductase
MQKKILLTGANGMLGKKLKKTLAKSFELFAFGKQDLDITDAPAVEKTFDKIKPDFCVNSAAYTAVDLAETEKEKTMTVNAEAVDNLAKLCCKFNTHLTHFSTDYVFDGEAKAGYTESAKPNPVNFYGESKLAGEKAIQKSGCEFAIIRTSWLFGDGKNFVNTMLELAKKMPEIKIVADQHGCPTYAKDLAEMTAELLISLNLERNSVNTTLKRGVNTKTQNIFFKIKNSQRINKEIFHLTNRSETNWANFARKIFELANLSTKVIDIPSREFPTPAKRPHNSILRNTKLPNLRNWEDALSEFLSKS